MQSTKRWIMISYLFSAAICWIFFYYLTDTIWDAVGLPVPGDWFITPAHIVAFVAAALCFIILNRSEKVNQYASEVASELSKVTWPEKKETLLSAGVISVMVIICALILFGFDSLWGTVIQLIY